MDWLLLWTTDWYILNIEFDSLDNSVVYASSSSVRARPYIKIWWSFPISNAAWKMMRCNTIRSNWPAVLHVRMWWMWCALKLEIVNGHVCSRSSTGNVVYTMLASRYFIFRFLVYHSSPALHQNKSSNTQERYRVVSELLRKYCAGAMIKLQFKLIQIQLISFVYFVMHYFESVEMVIMTTRLPGTSYIIVFTLYCRTRSGSLGALCHICIRRCCCCCCIFHFDFDAFRFLAIRVQFSVRSHTKYPFAVWCEWSAKSKQHDVCHFVCSIAAYIIFRKYVIFQWHNLARKWIFTSYGFWCYLFLLSLGLFVY